MACWRPQQDTNKVGGEKWVILGPENNGPYFADDIGFEFKFHLAPKDLIDG